MVLPKTNRVYVVDDDPSVRMSISFLLSTMGFLVRAWSSGALFLDDAPSLSPGCVLLDMRMPEFNGIQVIEALGEQIQQLHVIMMTGHGDIAMAVRTMKLGACDFLEKPCTENLLLTTLEKTFATLDAELGVRNEQVAARAVIGALSPREADVLAGLAKGLPNKIIAFQLVLSIRTVEMYRARMMERLGVRSLPEAVRLAFVAGMLDAKNPAVDVA